MLADMDSDELTEWMAYERVTGTLGPGRDDALMAILAATVSNTARAKGKKATPQDFLPKWDQNVKQPWQDMLRTVKTMNRRLKGTDLTKGGDDDGEPSGGTPGRDRDRHAGADGWRERRR